MPRVSSPEGGLFTRSFSLSKAEYAEIADQLQRMDESSTAGANPWDKAGERLPFKSKDVTLTVEHPGGGFGRYQLPACFLSTRQVSLLHSGFIHAGSLCTINIPTVTHGYCTVAGQIHLCRHIERSIHEIIVRFDTAIDPRQFLSLSYDSDFEAGDDFNPLDVTGEVLLLCDLEAKTRLLGHYLHETRVNLQIAETNGIALDLTKKRPFDLVIVDLPISQGQGVRSIEAVVDAGYTGPLIAISGESNAHKQDLALKAGASAVLTMPCQPRRFLGAVADLISGIGLGVGDEQVESDLRNETGMAELLDWYIEQVKVEMHALRKAISEDEFDKVRHHCQNLKETGAGYGYLALTEIASQAITALDSSYSIEESMPALKDLESVLKRMR